VGILIRDETLFNLIEYVSTYYLQFFMGIDCYFFLKKQPRHNPYAAAVLSYLGK